MRCLLIIGLFVLAVRDAESALDKAVINSVKNCVAGSNWKEDCNFCYCTDFGIGACTSMLCSATASLSDKERPELKIPTGVECLPGTTWKSECNYCMCLGDGYSACTNKYCPWWEDEPRRTCAPNTIWRNDCIICRCTSYGEPACSLLACYYPYSEEMISPFNNEL